MRTGFGSWVMQLKPDPDRSVDPVCSAAMHQQADNVLGLPAAQWAVQMGYDNAVKLLADTPGLGAGSSELHMVRIGTEAIALRILTGIATGDALADLVDEEKMIIRDFVHRNVSLEVINEGMRNSHAYMTSRILNACVATVPLEMQPVELQRAAGVILDFVNGHSRNTEQCYVAEQRSWSASPAAVVSGLVRRLLGNPGALGQFDLSDISRQIRYEVANRWHTGLVAWSATDDPAAPADLARATEDLLRATGARSILVVPQSDNVVWGWAGFTSETRSEPPRNIADGCLWAAIGTSAPGLDGFRATHQEALRARSVAEIVPAPSPGMVRYEDLRLLALLLQDTALATDFAARELKGLAGPEPRKREIRETVRAFLDTRSPQAVARELFIARNTVSYRLKQAEELLGHDLLGGQLELRTALLLEDHLSPCDDSRLSPALPGSVA